MTARVRGPAVSSPGALSVLGQFSGYPAASQDLRNSLEDCGQLRRKLQEQLPKLLLVNLMPTLTSKRPKIKEAHKVTSPSLNAWLGMRCPAKAV